MSKLKCKAKITDWQIRTHPDGMRLYGYIFDDEARRFADATLIHSSLIVSIDVPKRQWKHLIQFTN